MPTVLRLSGFRFFFYSEEGNEPPHIHVEKGGVKGKYWLEPLQEDNMSNFKVAERRKARKIIEQYQQMLKNKWYEYFGE
jgi:hypothetical protein